MDRVDLFRVFTHVVDCASFTRASDMLGLPRSTVSAAIAELEGRVGVRLLHRTTRKVAPTLDGEAFYERCRRVLEDVEETENLFRRSKMGPSGRIRVDVPERIGRLIIAPALPDFFDRYPNIILDLGMTDRNVNFVEDQVDCALRVGTLRSSGLIARSIGELPLINAASPDYLRRHGIPQTPSDLENHFAVNFASPTTGRVEPWGWMEDGAEKNLPMRGSVSVSSSEAYIACCLAGLGLIQIPAYDVRDDIAAGRLVEVMPNHRAEPMPMSVLYPHRQHLSRRLQAFADWLESLMRKAVTA